MLISLDNECKIYALTILKEFGLTSEMLRSVQFATDFDIFHFTLLIDLVRDECYSPIVALELMLAAETRLLYSVLSRQAYLEVREN